MPAAKQPSTEESWESAGLSSVQGQGQTKKETWKTVRARSEHVAMGNSAGLPRPATGTTTAPVPYSMISPQGQLFNAPIVDMEDIFIKDNMVLNS